MLDIDQAVRDRYRGAAGAREEALCCPVSYNPRLLEAIPVEVLERDYGCGDPSGYVREGDIVLDLGSGSGKICFIAAQIAGPTGRVIGVDANDEMLALARRAAPLVAVRIGYENTRFVRARIQDLRLDLEALDERLGERPVSNGVELAAIDAWADRLRAERPLVADSSVDIVVSNCALNLVRPQDKPALVREIFRVLRPGGRIAISDIVADEAVPDRLRGDPELWSGCVSGAFEERELLAELEAAGFYGLALDKWESEPFRVVDGIEFRSVTVTGRKGKEGACHEGNQAVVYRGPWRQVEDDDGHVFRRGERVAVCRKTFRILTSEPYVADLIAIEPRVAVPDAEQRPFDCSRPVRRSPRETKGEGYDRTTPAASACCGPDTGC